MCGIVAYFGGAGNHLTRVLTGMAAIIYRGADSTGLGLFGDADEPIRTRKSLGSVTDLIPALLKHPVYPDRSAALAAFWAPESGVDLTARQRSLLAIEGLAAITEGKADRDASCLSYDDLVNLELQPSRRLEPGSTGRPHPLPVYRIGSEDGLRECSAALVRTYDLDPAVVRSLFRQALQDALESRKPGSAPEISPKDILQLFDPIIGRIIFSDPAENSASAGAPEIQDPAVWETLWSLLADCRVVIPDDYDRDAVRCVFRVMDAALLTRFNMQPDLRERLDQHLERTWPDAVRLAPLDWQTLYVMEKAANVFGRAASCGLQLLQQEVVVPAMIAPGSTAGLPVDPIRPGETDPLTLRFLSSPILAHGRYALQSPITVENSHPFLDRFGRRAIAVNGVFDSEVEERLRRFLQQVAGLSFRTGNSAEYFSLLWGHYYQQLRSERIRFETIRRQTDGNLSEFGIGSQAIDYQIFKRLRDLSTEDMDEQAFIAAVHQFTACGGQIAVCGISLASPRRLYVASHNRPIFVVRRPDNGDVMVVSDVNAALGLFPQALIRECSRGVEDVRRKGSARLAGLAAKGCGMESIRNARAEMDLEEEACCRILGVEIYTLEGESRFARIEAVVRGGRVERDIHLMDLDGRPLEDVDPMPSVLRPPHLQRNLYAAYFEAHLDEIPDRMDDLLRVHTDDAWKPSLPLSRRTLERRFGPNLRNLQRVLLLGTGSSHHMALLARGFFYKCLPDVEVVALAPWEAEPLPRFISPEQDLVVLVSWSATTADMVECAKVLQAMGAVMVGVTEKRFADMALIAAKSAGLVPTLTGEEVTVSAVKSPPCLLLCLALLAAWIGFERRSNGRICDITSPLSRLPDMLRALRSDPGLKAFCREVATAHRDALSCLVFDALYASGAGREAALKLEENSWAAVGRALDYSEAGHITEIIRKEPSLVLVNATSMVHRAAALAAMQQLNEAGIPFAVLSYPCREKKRFAFLSQERCFLLPKVEDIFQPFVDMMAHCELALQFGRAHGRTEGGFPRNRAKSVTVGRSRSARIPSPAAVIAGLDVGSGDIAPSVETSSETPWEGAADFDRERKAYEAIRRSAAGAPVSTTRMDLPRLERILFDELPSEGHLVLAPMDRMAEAAALSAAFHWNPMLPCAVRVERASSRLRKLSSRNLLVICAATPIEPSSAERILDGVQAPCIWVGAPPPGDGSVLLDVCPGNVDIPWSDPERSGAPALYLDLCRLLTAAWSRRSAKRGEILRRQLDCLPAAVTAVLSDMDLKEDIGRLAASNRRYATGFFIGPSGSTVDWEDIFGRFDGPFLAGHVFGESAHGPLVTVDPSHGRKFVRIDDREAMVSAFGASNVAAWEKEYLDGASVDDFLRSPERRQGRRKPSPFFAEGRWFVPELRPDYDAGQDNLVILDAAGRRHLPLALDELSTFGCRYARMAVITQKSFTDEPDAAALYQHPVSHYLEIPMLPSSGRAIPDLLLPVILHLLGTALASAFEKVRSAA